MIFDTDYIAFLDALKAIHGASRTPAFFSSGEGRPAPTPPASKDPVHQDLHPKVGRSVFPPWRVA